MFFFVLFSVDRPPIFRNFTEGSKSFGENCRTLSTHLATFSSQCPTVSTAADLRLWRCKNSNFHSPFHALAASFVCPMANLNKCAFLHVAYWHARTHRETRRFPILLSKVFLSVYPSVSQEVASCHHCLKLSSSCTVQKSPQKCHARDVHCLTRPQHFTLGQ